MAFKRESKKGEPGYCHSDTISHEEFALPTESEVSVFNIPT